MNNMIKKEIGGLIKNKHIPMLDTSFVVSKKDFDRMNSKKIESLNDPKTINIINTTIASIIKQCNLIKENNNKI